MELTYTGWVFVEGVGAPCDNELESKGWMINTTGVDGLIPKHWKSKNEAEDKLRDFIFGSNMFMM